jgi:cyclase
MLHTRIIPVLTFKDGRMIKTIQFDQYRDVGHPITLARYYDSQDVDELILLDMTASQENRSIHFDIVADFAKESSMPLTVGGGIRSISDIRQLLQIGADKVSLNSAAIKHPALISEAANMFGSQCIVISIDAKLNKNQHYEVYINGGYEPSNLDPVTWAIRAESMGAGEILINSIDRDGTALGYDLQLIKTVSDAVKIPVIALGGVGILQDLVDGILVGASAVACSTLFNFTDNKPVKANAFVNVASKQNKQLKDLKVMVRSV